MSDVHQQHISCLNVQYISFYYLAHKDIVKLKSVHRLCDAVHSPNVNSSLSQTSPEGEV